MLLSIACHLPYVPTLASGVRSKEHVRDSPWAPQKHYHRELTIPENLRHSLSEILQCPFV